MIEDCAIERRYLWEKVLAETKTTEAELNGALESAKKSPVYRQWAHDNFAGAWKMLEEVGRSALFEAHILDIPPTDKPN